MALTGEEIDRIAQSIVEKIGPARLCRCGVAAWETRDGMDFIEKGILNQRSAWVLSDIMFLEQGLTAVETNCHIDISKTRDLIRRLENSVQRQDWEEAEEIFRSLKPSIWAKMEDIIHD